VNFFRLVKKGPSGFWRF